MGGIQGAVIMVELNRVHGVLERVRDGMVRCYGGSKDH